MINPPACVPFLNLKQLFLDHREEFMGAINQVLENAAYIGGKATDDFEKNFAAWVGPGNEVVGSANGTDAITIAAKALKLPVGSEAILPAMTYLATAEGLMHAGFKVKLVDVEPGTYLIDTTQLESAVTRDTKLIAPVHLYGQMAEMDTLRKIADANGCRILEDAAQAHGAQWKGKPVGHWGDVATYSFYPGKNLGAFGDAGAILSRHSEIIQLCRALGNHGGIKKYEHFHCGYNSRLDNLQAAILSVKLKYIDEWNNARRNAAKLYREMLSGISGLTLPVEKEGAKHSYHLFVVQVEDRDGFMTHMKAKGIDTGIHYPKAIHELPAFKDQAFAREAFPVAATLAKQGVSLPMCPTLSAAQLQQVGDAVRSYFG
jgi:dTDP-4-amino-4,6-dideoxygalactose transaminase